MKVILDKKLINEKGIKDFDLDPVNKEIVVVGKKLYIVTTDFDNNIIIKEFGGKLKNIEAIKFIKEEKDNNYKPNINPELPLEEQNILPETIDILALLKLNYWCNEEEKKELLELLNKNEQKFQKEAKEKYDIDIRGKSK